MGNTPSSEEPRKASQKLSKPRVESYVPPPGPLRNVGASASSSTRFSRSYLSASMPFSPRDFVSGAESSAVSDVYSERFDQSSRRLSRRQSEWPRSPFVPESPQLEFPNGRRHSFYANSAAGDRLSRANSMIYSEIEPPLTRTQSWHVHQFEEFNSEQTEEYLYRPQRLPRAKSEIFQGHPLASLESYADIQMRRTTSLTSHSQQYTTPLARTASDLSLCAPVRRRSVILTPGVATRMQLAGIPPIPGPTARRSHSFLREDELEIKANHKRMKHISMPSRPNTFEYQERAITPCESEYKQLGGMKFGSLRITNGSPVASPPEIHKRQHSLPDFQPLIALARNGSTGESPDEGLHIIHHKRQSSVTSPVARTFADAPASSPKIHSNVTPSKASEFNFDFMDDLIFGPFSNDSSPLEFNFQFDFDDSVSKTTAANRNNQPETHSHFGDVHNKLNNQYEAYTSNDLLEPSDKSTGGVSRSDSGFASTSSSESTRMTLSKADSGYSSNISLRSFQSSSQTRSGSDASIRYVADSPVPTYSKLRRTLEKSESNPTRFERSQRHGKASALCGGTEQRGSAGDRTSPEDTAFPVSSRMESTRSNRDRSISMPRKPSHKVDQSSATLNTIMSVESLAVPQETRPLDHIRDLELETTAPTSKLKKRRSLRKMAEFAQAKLPTLRSRNRKSITPSPATSEHNKPSEEIATDLDDRGSHSTSMTETGLSQRPTSNPSYANAMATPAHHDLPLRSSTMTSFSRPTKVDGQKPSRPRSSSLSGRGSASNLRVVIPDYLPPSPNLSEQSPQSRQTTPSPRAQRFHGIVDHGVPPPIPAQFRSPHLHLSPSLNLPNYSPRFPPNRSQNPLSPVSNAQERRQYVEIGHESRHRPIGRSPGLPTAPDNQNPPFRVLHSYNSPAYRGVPIWG